MKTKIRKGLFEANSSSTHSIVIGNNGENVKSNLPEELYFHGGEFGWEHKLYTDTETKASYLFTSLMYMDDPYIWIEKIKNILKNWGVEAKFEELIKGEYSNGTTYYKTRGFAYVDHGGENNDLVIELCENDELLMNYLFSDASYVETSNDNDEYDIFGEEPKNALYEYFKGN